MQKRLKEREEEPELKPLYKLKAFQTINSKIDTFNHNYQPSKEASVAPTSKKKTHQKFDLDLS